MLLKSFTNKFVLGSQYYRVIPPTEEWSEDFEHMKEIGLNTVKIEAVWSQIENSYGKYSWDEITGLLDTAQKKGLKVLMTLPFESIPDCVFNKYQCQVIDLKRKPVPVTRWFGGVMRNSCCWDNPGLRESIENFI